MGTPSSIYRFYIQTTIRGITATHLMLVSRFSRCYRTAVSNFRPNRFFRLCGRPHRGILDRSNKRSMVYSTSLRHPSNNCNVLLSHLTVPVPSNPLVEFSGLYDRLFPRLSFVIALFLNKLNYCRLTRHSITYVQCCRICFIREFTE
jgi:hypothetical protein